MFDKVDIRVVAGYGGDGSISFRHEKFIPYGGPDGGDGGNGGDVIIAVDAGVSSLRSYRHNRLYKAGRGGNGGRQKKHGKRGEDLVLTVPVGTMVMHSGDVETKLIADCNLPAQQEIVAKGGRGGLGNVHFTSSTNQAPRIAQKGEPGEEYSLTLELRLIADIGIIGYPNAGKSTLLTSASAAKPKIASYPFTTLEPVLGMVEEGINSYIWAEIPGLIEGAHTGKGLGHDFLRHVMRTKILVHLIDGTSLSLLEDMMQVNSELSMFDPLLAQKPQIVAVNKIDLPEVNARLTEIKKAFRAAGMQVMFVSAETGEGVPKLITETVNVLGKAEAVIEISKKAPAAIFRPQPRGTGVRVSKDEDVYVIEAPELGRIIARVNLADPEVLRQIQRPMTRMGARKALEKAGIKPGDKVRCEGFEWEW
ncbi:GTPase ObgE [Chloroflexota bacterium]